jgi:hypothetical protein
MVQRAAHLGETANSSIIMCRCDRLIGPGVVAYRTICEINRPGSRCGVLVSTLQFRVARKLVVEAAHNWKDAGIDLPERILERGRATV